MAPCAELEAMARGHFARVGRWMGYLPYCLRPSASGRRHLAQGFPSIITSSRTAKFCLASLCAP